MNKNLVLSAAIGYNFDQIKNFIISLRKYFSGEVHIIIDKNENKLEQEILKYDCKSIKTSVNKKRIQFKRYKIYLEFLKDKKFDNILLCDSRDIYFQNDPFKYDYKKTINFFLEDHIIKDCPYNSNWILKTYGKSKFDMMSEKTILCSGTVLGNYNKIKEYLHLMNNYIEKYRYRKKLKYLLTFRPDPEGRGCDQAHANFIVHNNLIKDIKLHKNSDGPIATVYYLKKINFDNNNRLLNNKGVPYNLVHQYDKRWDEFSYNFQKFIKNL